MELLPPNPFSRVTEFQRSQMVVEPSVTEYSQEG